MKRQRESTEGFEPRSNSPIRTRRLLAVLGISLLSVSYLVLVPDTPDEEMIDHALFRMTIEDMRGGVGYYEAMDTALAAVYGPERAGVTETIRAFRLPTMFYVFSALPDLRWIWYFFVVNAAAAGIAATYLTSRHLLGVAVTAYVLSLGMFDNGGVWVAQYLTIELWAVLPMIASIAFVVHRRSGLSASLGALAAAVRELTLPLLGLGVLFALHQRVNRLAWIVASVLVAVGYVLHGMAAHQFIQQGLGEGAIEGPSLVAIAEMTGFGVPGGLIVGPILWLLAVRHVVRRFPSWPVVIAPLLIPLYGLLADRPYWGILATPFVFVWGVSELIDMWDRRGFARSRHQTPAQDHPV